MKQSAGTLLYRRNDGVVEVLLVHPSGNYNRKAPWSIPKGEPDPDEELEHTARRETLEETGVAAPESLVSLGSIVYVKSRKTVHCFAGEVPLTLKAAPASWEVDRAEFLPLEEVRGRIHPDQAPLLDRLIALLREG